MLNGIITEDEKRAVEMLQEHLLKPKFTKIRRKTRLVVKKGQEYIALLLTDIPLIYTENKVVYVMDKSGKKYICDQALTQLQESLDSHVFFRANRQTVININFIRCFKPNSKVKLAVEMAFAETIHFIIISQETAPAFRKWMHES